MNFEKLCKNLEDKGYKVSCFDTRETAADYINSQINETTVGIGGSMTVLEMGLYEQLSLHNSVNWHWKLSENETAPEIIKKARTSEIYISSVNGISEDGEIINIDGNCNRVAGIFYGHKKVYLIVGKNKVAKDFNAALFRARNTAAPLNAKRLGAQTPCAKNGDKCYDCKSGGRICRGLSVLWDKPSTGDFEIILIDENLGY